MGRITRTIRSSIDGATESISGDPVEVVIEADITPNTEDIDMRVTWSCSTRTFALTLTEDSVNDMLDVLECIMGVMCQRPAAGEDDG